MKPLIRIWFACVLFAAVPVLSQVDNSGAQTSEAGSTSTEDRMLTPPPVGGEAYPESFAAESESNYLRGGLAFSTSYDDNALGATSGHPMSDISYSLWPSIALDRSSSRLHSLLSYAPGFTFYNRTSARNEADHNLGFELEYRLSPHVTLSLHEMFQKSSNVFNNPTLGDSGSVTGSAQAPNESVIAPIADRLSNRANGGITYQFRANSMVGISGTFVNLYYPHPAEVPGLYDSTSRGGSIFYSLRLGGKHYLGATYQYQDLLAHPPGEENQTQTHGAFLFYSVYPSRRFSLSFFGGPQHSSTVESPLPAMGQWSPAGGASLGWQAQHTSLAVSYSRVVSGSSGLMGAVRYNGVTASLRQQLTRSLSASFSGGYASNEVLAGLSQSGSSGRSISGSASLQRQLGEHLSLQAGYMRLHQRYESVSILSAAPDTNREWISISYQFSRPLGR